MSQAVLGVHSSRSEPHQQWSHKPWAFGSLSARTGLDVEAGCLGRESFLWWKKQVRNCIDAMLFVLEKKTGLHRAPSVTFQEGQGDAQGISGVRICVFQSKKEFYLTQLLPMLLPFQPGFAGCLLTMEHSNLSFAFWDLNHAQAVDVSTFLA